jgi:hypothetical protein
MVFWGLTGFELLRLREKQVSPLCAHDKAVSNSGRNDQGLGWVEEINCNGNSNSEGNAIATTEADPLRG